MGKKWEEKYNDALSLPDIREIVQSICQQLHLHEL